VALERFEFNVSLHAISLVHGWLHWTLQSIASPVFNEFVLWMLDTGSPWTQMNRQGWAALDSLLISIAGRNPKFRVVIKGGYYSFMDGVPSDDGARTFLSSYLPFTSLSAWTKYEFAGRSANRFGKLITDNN